MGWHPFRITGFSFCREISGRSMGILNGPRGWVVVTEGGGHCMDLLPCSSVTSVLVVCTRGAGGTQWWLWFQHSSGYRKPHLRGFSRPTPGVVQLLLPPPPAAGHMHPPQVHRGLANSHQPPFWVSVTREECNLLS